MFLINNPAIGKNDMFLYNICVKKYLYKKVRIKYKKSINKNNERTKIINRRGMI